MKSVEEHHHHHHLEHHEYRVYPSRWLVLVTVASLNVGVNTLLFSYSAVANDAARYFDKEPEDIDVLTTVALLTSLIVALVATWLVDTLGLRKTVLITGTLCFLGGLTRMVSTFPGLNDSMEKDLQYTLSLIAQILEGLANPLAFCLPTKVAVDWFPEKEAPLASGLMTMSFVLGLALATGITPILFADEDLIEWMNVAWFVPTAIAFAFSVLFVKSDQPPIPPSESAVIRSHIHMHYWRKMKLLFTNKNFLVLVFCIGSLLGYMNGLLSTLTHITCAVGYTSEFTGLCTTILLFSGLVGGLAASFLYRQTGLLEEQAKITFAFNALISMPILYLLVVPDEEVLIAFLLGLAGAVGFGVLPMGAELTLENTYPVDPAAGLSLIFCMNQLSGIVVIALSDVMVSDISKEDKKIEKCTEEEGDFEANDHSSFIIFLMCVVPAIAIIFMVFLRTEYRRRRANHGDFHEEEELQVTDLTHERRASLDSAVRSVEERFDYLDKYDQTS